MVIKQHEIILITVNAPSDITQSWIVNLKHVSWYEHWANNNKCQDKILDNCKKQLAYR